MIPQPDDAELEALRAEMNRFRRIDQRRQRKAVVAVVLSVLAASIVGIPFVVLFLYLPDHDSKIWALIAAPPILVGAWVHRKLYPRDFWGRT